MIQYLMSILKIFLGFFQDEISFEPTQVEYNGS
jgi:hypothetical protein